ncbi:hypothetical protein [Streptomyces griseorubiginosus]|uniref:hypothetical protein n=1 Tax=Streptomyces griseorubiginosus TaxID=67304 RepID=UPI0036EC3C3C
MTVLTQAMAAGTPGRLAPYSYQPRPSAAAIYHRAVSGYAAKFDINGRSLRQLEIREGSTDAPRDHVEDLHNLLHGPWRAAIERFDNTVTDADYRAVADLPDTHPRHVAYLDASSAMDTWLACEKRLHEAWMDWSLDLTGTVDIPEPPGPEPVVVEDGHRVPDCTGYCAQDEVCAVELADLGSDKDDQHLVVEVYAEPDEPVKAVVFTFGLASDATLLRTTDPAELQRKADELHQFASRINHAAYVLDQLQKREATA